MDFGNGNENLIPIIAIVCGIMVAIVAIVSGCVSSTKKLRQREETRREIAAYVAEGSMTADDAERLLKAEPED
jgi:uncharacterized protein YggU (UPF0235/DUF167 family)